MTLDTTAIRARAECAERDRDRLAAQYTSAYRTIDQIATDRDALRAEVERLRDAADNVVIAFGMGWDMDGVIGVLRAALQRKEGNK